jgi:hypothetical protein
MKNIKCLWCGKEFEWDDTMFKFCDRCVGNLEALEKCTRHALPLTVIAEEWLSQPIGSK